MKLRQLAVVIFAVMVLILMPVSGVVFAKPTAQRFYASFAVSQSLQAAAGFGPPAKFNGTFSGVATTKLDSEIYAFNACLKEAKAHLDVYKNDCNSNVWVFSGWISIAYDAQTSPVWGSGWASTLEQANQNAIATCQSLGGQQCGQLPYHIFATESIDTDPNQQTTGGPGFGTGNNKYPTSGVYQGVGVFYTDSTGLQLSWATSDVYVYSDVPRDWRVDISYTNVGTQNLNLTCSGDTDPAQVWEDMKGTGNSGRVHASETFCSTHPDWTMTLVPGATFSSNATFHNVPWKGGTVSIIWYNFGRTPALDPWQTAFQ